MTDAKDTETLRRFVLRARRVQAHSLVHDWKGLLHQAEGAFEGHIDISGKLSLNSRLPQNEEAFESLAARVRPMTLKSEPVYHVTVFDALERLLAAAPSVIKADLQRFQELRYAWNAAEIQGTQTQAYALQSMRIDGTDATNLVSDTQLAAGWLYADLVHADAQGPKKEALAFPLRERYSAAVRLFSRIAALTVETLRFVEHLRETETISITQQAWDEDVVVGATELVREVRAFVAPLGTPMPDLRDAKTGLDDDWTQFTVTELLRQKPANHVRVILERSDGSAVAAYDAAVAHRQIDETVAGWHVLVAGSVMFQFEFIFEQGQLVNGLLESWQAFDSTNRLKLASTVLMRQMHDAATMKFEVRGHPLITLEAPTFETQAQCQFEVMSETLENIVAIESITGQAYAPCNGEFSDRDRVRLCRARLLWEGQVVRAMAHPVTVTAFEGAPPQVVVVDPGTVEVGGASVPTPTVCMRHPAMVCSDQGPATTEGLNARKFEVRPPDGEHFLAWNPSLVRPSGDEDLVPTAAWNLTGIDETAFLY